MNTSTLFPSIKKLVKGLDLNSISKERQNELQVLVEYIQDKSKTNEPVNLNFICTHNSRRSQFSQVWMRVLALAYELEISTFSGGVEVTECNHRTIASLQRFGFEIEAEGSKNPVYSVRYSSDLEPLKLFSKLFDTTSNPKENFAAVMTCSHADENCPFIPGAEKRISLPYEDPKDFDDTELESEKYDERSLQIATELSFVLSKLIS